VRERVAELVRGGERKLLLARNNAFDFFGHAVEQCDHAPQLWRACVVSDPRLHMALFNRLHRFVDASHRLQHPVCEPVHNEQAECDRER